MERKTAAALERHDSLVLRWLFEERDPRRARRLRRRIGRAARHVMVTTRRRREG